MTRPMISVLVRSMGRATLAEALASVAVQSWAPIEVVVVNARGGTHDDPAGLAGDARVRLVNPGGPALARAAAANLALASARGDWLIFLDDDDLFLPSHLERLGQALLDDPQAVAAYAGVECIESGDGPARAVHVYDEEVDRAGMMLANRLPIHAVLFRAEALRAGPPIDFDESLEAFEDWDFWLRLTDRGPFVRVPGVSAVYRLAADQGSGHADAANPWRRAQLERLAQRQLQRWTPTLVADLIECNAARTAQAQQTQQALAAAEDDRRGLIAARDHLRDELRAQAAELRAQRAELRAQRAELDKLAAIREQHLHQIAALYASTSWRVTRPLRALARVWVALRDGRARRTIENLVAALRLLARRHGWRGALARLPGHLAQWRRHLRTLASPVAIDAEPFAAASNRRTIEWRPHPEIDGVDECLDHKVSVVIPTLNGGDDFVLLLRRLRDQQAVREVEIVVVDSGSTDGTVAAARAAGAHVVEIRPAEFSHSHARNLGADAASGDHLIFMVQDAYPVGRLWLYALLRWLLDHRGEGVVAASCSEYCRSDSDLLYDCAVQTHYRFLGCLDADRIGAFAGSDHMALRSMGQLSDVACLIPRELFQRYRYRGDYAEDLDLGIRLIRDGHRVAMLASVKVIHSHRRPAIYHLKRSFVDVVFLVGLFDDFRHPACASVPGLVDGVLQCARQVSTWLRGLEASARHHGVDAFSPRALPEAGAGGSEVGDDAIDGFVARLVQQARSFEPGNGSQRQAEARQFADAFVARVDHLHQYLRSVYGECDERLVRELSEAMRKTFAATLGAALAYVWLDREGVGARAGERAWIDALFAELKAGV